MNYMSKKELIKIIEMQSKSIKKLTEELEEVNKHIPDISAWSTEDAQRDGGGFTDSEILDSERNNW